MSRKFGHEVVCEAYAVMRRGQNRWDGWYDILRKKDRRPIRTFVRVPSQEGFADAELARQAAEILAEWDLAAGYGVRKPAP